jgi:OmcA/MtrC family decaheme c-type cytochrome
MKLMVHKFHKGKSLTKDYVVNTSVARKTDTSLIPNVVTGVTFPGQLRTCTKCHDGSANAAVRTAQGDNWLTKPSKNACWACHDDYNVAGSRWQLAHAGAGLNVVNPDTNPDSACVICHSGNVSAPFNTGFLHQIPEWVMGENYQYNIWSTTLNTDRTVTVEYSVSNPKYGTDYDLLNPDRYKYVIDNGAGTQKTNTFIFGGGTIYIGWGTDDYTNSGAIGRPWTGSCTTLVASGVPSCGVNGLPQSAVPATPNTNGAGGALIARGQPVALNIMFDPTVTRVGSSNRFKITSTPVPASATGTAVVAVSGLVNLQKDATTSYAIPVRDAVSYLSLGGSAAAPRREVVSTAKCETCHDRFLKNHGHGGSSNTPEVCVICHNGNNPLNGTTVSGGAVTQYAESGHFKRAVHIWHKKQATDNKNPATLLGQGNNFPAQIPLTGSFGVKNLRNCNICHVNNSYQRNKGVMGTSRTYAVDLSIDSANASVTDTDASDNAVISPKAATCSSCHDLDIQTQTRDVRQHMMIVGGATFGGMPASGVLAGGTLAGDLTVTQAGLGAGNVNELCEGCHAPGLFVGVDVKHGLK